MPRTPEERDVALECLKLAVANTGDLTSTLKAAESFFAFVTGEQVQAEDPKASLSEALNTAVTAWWQRTR